MMGSKTTATKSRDTEKPSIPILANKQRMKTYAKKQASVEDLYSRHSMPLDLNKLKKEQSQYRFMGDKKRDRYQSYGQDEEDGEVLQPPSPTTDKKQSIYKNPLSKNTSNQISMTDLDNLAFQFQSFDSTDNRTPGLPPLGQNIVLHTSNEQLNQ